MHHTSPRITSLICEQKACPAQAKDFLLFMYDKILLFL